MKKTKKLNGRLQAQLQYEQIMLIKNKTKTYNDFTFEDKIITHNAGTEDEYKVLKVRLVKYDKKAEKDVYSKPIKIYNNKIEKFKPYIIDGVPVEFTATSELLEYNGKEYENIVAQYILNDVYNSDTDDTIDMFQNYETNKQEASQTEEVADEPISDEEMPF